MSGTYDPGLSVLGRGDEAIVLVPGMNGSGELFYRQVPLLEQSYRVATYTLRDDAEHLATLVDDLASVVDRVAPRTRRAIIVGESFGGAIAMTFALTHPERVSELVIVNSFPRFARQLRLKLAIAGLTAMPWNTMPLVRRATAWRLHSRHTHRTEIQRFVRLTAQTTRQGYISRLKLLRTYDVRHRLRELNVPTLFLAAELDHLVPSVSEARFMTRQVPESDMRVLAGHGHICLIAPDLDLSTLIAEWRARKPALR
jgi:pimeloyl-ACP methyl ester carboxylesterase